jgi:hypothetical protein
MAWYDASTNSIIKMVKNTGYNEKERNRLIVIGIVIAGIELAVLFLLQLTYLHEKRLGLNFFLPLLPLVLYWVITGAVLLRFNMVADLKYAGLNLISASVLSLLGLCIPLLFTSSNRVLLIIVDFAIGTIYIRTLQAEIYMRVARLLKES